MIFKRRRKPAPVARPRGHMVYEVGCGCRITEDDDGAVWARCAEHRGCLDLPPSLDGIPVRPGWLRTYASPTDNDRSAP